MGELLPGNLSLTEEEPKQKSKDYRVSRITEWLQGFAVYVAVLSHNQPACIPDLMGYQLLNLEAYHEFKDTCWLGYDRRFRQCAASDPTLEPDGPPLSLHCGVWPSKAKLGPVAVSIASAYPTAQWSANYR